MIVTSVSTGEAGVRSPVSESTFCAISGIHWTFFEGVMLENRFSAPFRLKSFETTVVTITMPSLCSHKATEGPYHCRSRRKLGFRTTYRLSLFCYDKGLTGTSSLIDLEAMISKNAAPRPRDDDRASIRVVVRHQVSWTICSYYLFIPTVEKKTQVPPNSHIAYTKQERSRATVVVSSEALPCSKLT